MAALVPRHTQTEGVVGVGVGRMGGGDSDVGFRGQSGPFSLIPDRSVTTTSLGC